MLESFSREMSDDQRQHLTENCWIRTDEMSDECYLLFEKKDHDFYDAGDSAGNASDFSQQFDVQDAVEESEPDSITPIQSVRTGPNYILSPHDDSEEVQKKLKQFSPVLHSVFGD